MTNQYLKDTNTNIYTDFREKRSSKMYYDYVIYMVQILAADSKSIIDVGSGNSSIIERFDWIPKKHALDIQNPCNSNNVLGIKADFFEYEPTERYDFGTCLHVLEHIPDAARFASKLLI